MSWTDERVETLKSMWAEGKSASQIAKELGGVTRNAVIGKVHRLGLSNRVGGPDRPEDELAELHLAERVAGLVVANAFPGRAAVAHEVGHRVDAGLALHQPELGHAVDRISGIPPRLPWYSDLRTCGENAQLRPRKHIYVTVVTALLSDDKSESGAL